MDHVGTAGQFALGSFYRDVPRSGMTADFNQAMLGLTNAVLRAKALREESPTPEQGAQAVSALRAASAKVREAITGDRHADQRKITPLLQHLARLDHSLTAESLRGYSQ